MWIGYEDVDRLITYPDVHNLSGCSQPIRMFTTYPRARREKSRSPPHGPRTLNLSACAPGEARRRAILNTGLSVVSIVGEGAAGVSRLPVSAPRIQVAECTTGVLASHAVIRNLVGRGQLNEAGALSSVARALWWDPWAPKRCDTAPRSSYRLVSMATRQPVVPQIFKE